MTHLPILITDLAFILIIAGITTLICKKLKQPVIIGYVLAGFLLSPVAGFFPMVVAATEEIEILAEIGVIFLMFGLGLEFNFQKMAQVGVSGTLAATIQIVGMVLIGYLIGVAMGWSTTDSLFLGGMLSMSSTIITVKAIEDCGMRQKKFASLAIGTLIIEDIAAIFLMLILSTVSVSQGDGASLFLTIGKLLFYLAFWLLLGIFLVPSLIRRINRLLTGEALLIVALALCFGMVLLADAIGFSTALGAFMAGSLLAGTTVAEKTEELITPCKDLFVAVFFVSVGFLVVPATLVEYIVPILILIAVTIVGKVLLLVFSYLLTRQDLATATHGALSQTQVGEFSFVIASLGLSLGVTADFLYPVIVAVALMTTFTTPFLLKTAPKLTDTLEKRLPAKLITAIRERSRSESEEDAPRKPESAMVWRRFLKHSTLRVALYTLVCAGVIALGHEVLLPWALAYFPDALTKAVVMVILVLLLLPFLPQLMVSHDPDFTTLWVDSRFNRLPLTIIMGVRIAIAIGLLMTVPILFYDTIHWWLLLLMVPVAFIASRSRRLRGSYLTIAAKFIANLNERQLLEAREAGGLLWENKELLVEAYCLPEGSPLLGHSLKELRWGQTLHLNVIRLVRGKKIDNLPAGDEVPQAGDVIVIYGTVRAVENFRLVYGDTAAIRLDDEDCTLRRYIVERQEDIAERDQLYCYGTRIHRNSPFAGKSVRDSGLRKERSCFVIGVERDLLPITELSPNFILRGGDTVWLLATVKTMVELLQDEVVDYYEDNRCTIEEK